MKKLLIITDTTEKQTNGVVRTLNTTINILKNDFIVECITPDQFKTISLPLYKEIDISLNVYTIGHRIKKINPDYIHIATEGPVGLAGKLYCDRKGYKYSTSYHSMFPEFLYDMFKIPAKFTYPYFKWFHSKSKNVLVPTNLVKNLLELKGFSNIIVWRRGVDRMVFNSTHRLNIQHKYILCVSRVSKEKGLDIFCQLEVPDSYTKILVGDGPYLKELKQKYLAENIHFVGKKKGQELSEYYANADAFVFPSKTDTFGLTQLESIASGTPVIAFNGTVSEEIIKHKISGILVDNITIDCIIEVLELARFNVESESLCWTWDKCTETFKNHLVTK